MPAPKVIGPYEIVDLLDRGGMGEVYKAVDTRMYRRPVALKLISEALGADPRALSKFDQEVETAANLSHPNIVQIYDHGEDDGRRYFAMELLDGPNLTDIVKEHNLRPLDARLEIIAQICDALDYAHTHGVVHRDIKPANIKVITRGGTDHVKVIDFGIAHVERKDRTRTVVQPGTTLYMSPEQLNDEQVSPKSDLFSLGIVAYELCAGVHPFKARTEFLTGSNIMREKQAPLRSVEPTAPEALETLFERLLEKDAENRPSSAAAVGVELKAIMRQLRASSSDSEPSFFGNLDEMTGLMVERIVHWAKGKEETGAIVEALEAYKRAILLAPSAPWLHARVARLEGQLQRAPGLDVPPEDDAGLRTSSRNRHREAFVRDRIVDAGAALDEGELDQASSIAAAILRLYPDESEALALMDRIVLYTDRGLPVKAFRQALRAAREAMVIGDLDAAQRSLDMAVGIWPDSDEVLSVGHELEQVRLVEMAKALAICDETLVRASADAITDDAVPAEVARAREALRRAEELGAPATLVGGKRSVLERLLSDVRARTEERTRAAQEAEEARRAEVKRLLGDASRMLASAGRATSADAASARAALADVRAALDAIARAEAQGADPAETAELKARSAAAAGSLEDRIAREEARDREISSRLVSIRKGLAEAEPLIAGEADEAVRAEELLTVVETELAAVAAARPSAKELSELRSTATGFRERIAKRRREEDELRARALEERRRREEKARLEREAQEREERLAREAREKEERAEREARDREVQNEKKKAAAKAERLRALLAEARKAFKEADDLAASIETEADLMLQPLAAARSRVEEMLELEPGEADAKALSQKIEKLAGAAKRHADEAARLRQQAHQRKLDDELERSAALRAARKKWLAIGAGATVVVAMMAGGIATFNGWQKRKAVEDEVQHREQLQKKHDDASARLAQAGRDIEELGGTISAIATEDARRDALARCDAVTTKLEGARQLDASHEDLPRLTKNLSTLRAHIEGLAIPSKNPSPPHDELADTLAEIGKELDAAGNAPKSPVAAVESALARADHGIELATAVLKTQPTESHARNLLASLKQTRAILQRRLDELNVQPPPPVETWRKDLSSAETTTARVEAQLKRAGPLSDPESAKADCQAAGRLVDGVLRDHSGDAQAVGLQRRLKTAFDAIQSRSIALPTPSPSPRQDNQLASIQRDVTSIQSDAKRLSLTSSADVTARIALDRQALEKLRQAGSQDWAPAKTSELQSDLDTSSVWSLFHRFHDGLVARSKVGILEVYPSYPSWEVISKLRALEYNFDVVELNVSARTAVVRETSRAGQYPDYWDKPNTRLFKYTLDRRPDGSWFIVSGTSAR